MKNTKLKAIFNISEEINTVSSKYSDFLESVIADEMGNSLSTIGNVTLTGRSGLSYNFSVEQDARFLDCRILGKDIDELIVLTLSEPTLNWNESSTNQDFTFQDVIADINDQFALQNTYGSLANHLTTAVKIDSAHLDTIIADKDFRDLLIDYCKDGSLSQSGFLSALQQMYESTKSVCEEQNAIDIDDSRPGYLRGIGAIFSTILLTLSEAVSAVVAVFSKILGFIFITISTLLRAIFNKASDLERFSFDVEADTDYINYPVCAQYNEDISIHSNEPLKVYEIGGLDVYLYNKGGTYYDINAFLSLRYHFNRTIDFLYSNPDWLPTVVRDENDTNVLVVTSASECKLLNLPDTCYLSMDEKYALLSNEEELLKAIALNLLISFGAILSHHLNVDDGNTIFYVSTSPELSFDFENFNDNYICAQFFNFCYVLRTRVPDFHDTTWTFVYDFITYMRDVVLAHVPFNDDGLMFSAPNVPANFVCYWTEPILGVESGYQWPANNIPSSRFIELPLVEPGTFKTAAILTAIATTVTFIAATAFNSKMKKIRTRRAVRKSGQLSRLKGAFENNPTPENETAYVNYILKQNRRAKIFGGSVYDPSNGWFETSNTSSTITFPILNEIKKLISG